MKGLNQLKKLTQFVVLILSIIMISGCSTGQSDSQKATAVMKTPDTLAFKDDFTRKFIDSNKEVVKGYYNFKSMTEGYTMLFPINGRVFKDGFTLNSYAFETYRFSEEVKKENLVYDYKVTYENRPITSDIELNLALLSNDVGYEGNYEQFDQEGKMYYYAKVVANDGKSTTYRYFSYIKSNQSEKAISYIMSSAVAEPSENGKLEPEKVEEKFLNMIKSIDFAE